MVVHGLDETSAIGLPPNIVFYLSSMFAALYSQETLYVNQFAEDFADFRVLCAI
jgi:hypothetical protein